MVNKIGETMEQSTFSISNVRHLARELVDVNDDKRKQVLKTMETDMKLKVVEEMVKIRLERMRGPDGTIRATTV
tara:strand:- start:324 stop:545 length:222 start_codon:yes stop_codon:yes gene_type:complete